MEEAHVDPEEGAPSDVGEVHDLSLINEVFPVPTPVLPCSSEPARKRWKTKSEIVTSTQYVQVFKEKKTLQQKKEAAKEQRKNDREEKRKLEEQNSNFD